MKSLTLTMHGEAHTTIYTHHLNYLMEETCNPRCPLMVTVERHRALTLGYSVCAKGLHCELDGTESTGRTKFFPRKNVVFELPVSVRHSLARSRSSYHESRRNEALRPSSVTVTI